MAQTTEVVIIGGGVVGCAIAYYLSKAHVDVIVVEQGEIGSQASGAAAGLLAPLGPLSGPGPFADLLLAGFALFPALVAELEDATAIHLGYEQTGALRIVRNPKRVAHLRKRMAAWQPLGLKLEWLSGEEARQREPLLALDTCAAIYAAQESQIQAPALVRAFSQAARNQGAQFFTQQTVVGLETSKDRVTGVHTASGETMACHSLIIANGAWAAQCGAWLNTQLPIRPLRGQLLSFAQMPNPLQHIIFGEAAYLIPRGSSIIAGATRENVGFDCRVTEDGTLWLRETSARLVPALTHSTRERAWAGLRPTTPDSHPLLGALPGWQNVIVAAGHTSVGILLSAITGQTITELVITGHVSHSILPFSPERFLFT